MSCPDHPYTAEEIRAREKKQRNRWQRLFNKTEEGAEAYRATRTNQANQTYESIRARQYAQEDEGFVDVEV
jgi:hypothetical protein